MNTIDFVPSFDGWRGTLMEIMGSGFAYIPEAQGTSR
jgi:hypothetical protein